MTNDFKEKRLTKKQLELANVLRYMDERMLNLVEQIRAVAIAANVSPEDFQKAFADHAAQEQFYIKLHAAEDIYEQSAKTTSQAEDDSQEAGDNPDVGAAVSPPLSDRTKPPSKK